MKQNLDFPSLVTRMAEKHMNSPLTDANKTLLMNRLNQLFKTPDHPPYAAMIQRAIVTLSERRGSSEESISMFLEKEYKDLPVAHLTFLKHHLAKLCELGDITLTRGNKYVISGDKTSLKTTAKSKESQVKRNFKWDLERQQRKSISQFVQQRKFCLEATVKINKRPVKRMFKWDYERKQRRLKKLLTQRRNQKKNYKVKVTEKHSEPNNVQENRSVDKEPKESSQKLVIPGPKKRTYPKRLKGHGLLSEALRRSKRLRNDFKQENEVERKPEELSEQQCIQMHGTRNLSLKATVKISKRPVKRMFKWDYERKQRRLKMLAQKENQMKNDEVKVTEKHSEPNDVQENRAIEGEAKEISQELVMDAPVKRTCRKRLQGHGLLSETLRCSNRLQNDTKQENGTEKKHDLLIEPAKLSEPKCIQIQPRRSARLAGKEQEIKLSCELQRPQGRNVEPDMSRITELQQKVPENRDKKAEPDSSHISELVEKEHANQMSENQDVVIRKCEEIKTGKKQEIKLSCELQRPQGQNVEPDMSRITEWQEIVPENRDKKVKADSGQVTKLLEKGPANQMPENQAVVVKKCEEIKIYRRRSKAEIQARLIVKDTKKEVESEVSKSQTSSICIDTNDDQSLGNLEDDRLITWVRKKRLLLRQQKSDSKVVADMDEQAANGSCSALVVATDELCF